MYEDTVRSLKACSVGNKPCINCVEFPPNNNCMDRLMLRAAKAIEELSERQTGAKCDYPDTDGIHNFWEH